MTDDVLDFQKEPSVKPLALRKAAMILKIYIGVLATVIVSAAVLIPFFLHKKNTQLEKIFWVFDGLLILYMFVMPLVGLFYSWKSYRNNEGTPGRRLLYGIGHVAGCVLMMFFLALYFTTTP